MHESKPQGFVHDYLAYLLARASHLISSSFHTQIRDHGLSVMEWRVMASLSDSPPLTISTLADIVLAQQPTVTKLVARMVDQGWVTRECSTQDKRKTLVALTPQGRTAVAPLLVLAKQHEADVLDAVGAQTQDQLKAQLRAFIAHAKTN